MGQFEKIVVLTVLSVIAVILVITLGTSEDPLTILDGSASMGGGADVSSAGTGDPAPIPGKGAARPAGPPAPAPRDLDIASPFEGRGPARSDPQRAGGLERAWPKDGPEALEREAGGPGREGLLLSSNVAAGERPAPAAEAGLPEGSALVTLRGLEDTWDEELKSYTWRQGDSFATLAERFYGDAARAALLRLYNEGRDSLQPGEAILVPVYDRRGAAPRRITAVGVHVVADGESLWSIAKRHYGRGTDWQRLYEANRDLLASPDDVRVGMELRIPRAVDEVR